jgi:hypothetical protein
MQADIIPIDPLYLFGIPGHPHSVISHIVQLLLHHAVVSIADTAAVSSPTLPPSSE